jgi:hypothetical protein
MIIKFNNYLIKLIKFKKYGNCKIKVKDELNLNN